MALLRIAVAAVLALDAVLVASGIAALTRDVSVAPKPRRAEPDPATARAVSRGSAGAILRRNAFDSETGPLDVAPIPVERLVARAAASRWQDPLRAPDCPDLVVFSTAEFEDPRRSTAVLRAGEENRARVRRVGDRVGDGVVAFIGHNPLASGPAVWVDGPAALCQARLFSLVSPDPASTAPPAASTATAAAPADGDAGGDLAARIRPLGPRLVQVDRAIVDPLFERYEQYAKWKGSRPPTEASAEPRGGLELGSVSPDGVLARLGFQSKDRVVSVDGHPAGSLDAAFIVLSRLRTSSQIRIEVERHGRLVLLEVAVR